MAEWPKRLRVWPEAKGTGRYVDVIPASIGRELYGALKELKWIRREYLNEIQAIPTVQDRAATQALLRYEREVGSE